MHMVIERRSEAVQKGDGTESRASYAGPVAGTGRARRSTKQSFYSRDEDPRRTPSRRLRTPTRSILPVRRDPSITATQRGDQHGRPASGPAARQWAIRARIVSTETQSLNAICSWPSTGGGR